MSLLILTVLLITMLLLLTLWWYSIFYRYRKHLKAFPIVDHIPLLGIVNQIKNSSELYVKSLTYSQSLGKNVFGMLGPFPILFTSDPKVFSLILGSSKHIDKPSIYKVLEAVIKNSLLLCNGNEWRQQKKLLTPAFNYSIIMQNIQIFNEESDLLVKTLAGEVNKKSTTVGRYVEEWSLQQIYKTMMGGSTLEKHNESFLHAIKEEMELIIKRILKPHEFFDVIYVFTKTFWKERKISKFIDEQTKVLIKKRREELLENKSNQSKTSSLINILIKLKEVDETVTEDFITKQLNLMIIAGYDTTATAVSFALYNLSIFPEIQKTAYEEIFSMLGDDINQPITHQHINNMTYLDLVIKESMRINTTVPIYLRSLNEDVDFDGTTLPKGLTIMFAAHAMHLDPDLYHDPQKFIPERFLPENLNSNRYSYAPFVGGIRSCIGQKYATLSMKVVLAKLLLNYEFFDASHKLDLASEIILKSKNGISVVIRKRNHNL